MLMFSHGGKEGRVAGKVELLLYRFHHFSLCLHCKKHPLVLLPIPLILKARPITYVFDVDIRRKRGGTAFNIS